MEQIYFLCPTNQAEYQYILHHITPKLDDAGISFHVCRPSEDIAGVVIKSHEKEVSK